MPIAWCWRLLAFFGGLFWCSLSSRFGYWRGPGAEQFPVFLGQRLLLQLYACAVTCGRSFTVLSVWGVLISFWSISVFSPTLLPLLFYYRIIIITIFIIIVIFIGYYRCYYFHGASGSVWRVLGLGLGMAGRARSLLAGRAGFWGALAALASRFLGTQPPRATQALIICFNYISFFYRQ